MGLRINEATDDGVYEFKQYTGSKKENANASENEVVNSGVIYEHDTKLAPESCVYTKKQILGTTASTENMQFQNNLKILGFYSALAVTDGNLGSQESLRAIKNFQRVYGLPINGGSNEQTRTKLNEVMTFYNSLKNSDLSTVAQIVNGYSDYNESIVKADVKRTWTFLRAGMGLTAKQAAGVMGNIMHESGASPTNAQDSKIPGSSKLRDTTYAYSATDGIAYGIIQWQYSSRKQGLLDMANNMGSTVSDSNVQFAYLRNEVETSLKAAWKKITDEDDVENAAKVFCAEIEITAWNSNRLEKANIVNGALA